MKTNLLQFLKRRSKALARCHSHLSPVVPTCRKNRSTPGFGGGEKTCFAFKSLGSYHGSKPDAAGFGICQVYLPLGDARRGGREAYFVDHVSINVGKQLFDGIYRFHLPFSAFP